VPIGGPPYTDAVILLDDVGQAVQLVRPPTRVVSLVPSLTEALALTVPDRLVGATDWCTHPQGLDVRRVRGTKNPDHRAIGELAPDLVVANREENRRVDVERLRGAGIPVWVTVIESVDQALGSLRRLCVDVLGVDEPTWLVAARRVWTGPVELPPAAVVVPIWRDPWMVVGSRTFTGDLLTRLGLGNRYADSTDRYPKVELGQLHRRAPDLVVLPDEPYAFSPDDGPEAFSGTATVLVSGRNLTWYGPAMVGARAELTAQIASALAARPDQMFRR
jgi:ABC-type Fe3+-hydroxamate transport system substrate-binding protein